MMVRTKILPGTGRWRAEGVTEGFHLSAGAAHDERGDPSTSFAGPPPRSGEE